MPLTNSFTSMILPKNIYTFRKVKKRSLKKILKQTIENELNVHK